jgi:hypothetical protein
MSGKSQKGIHTRLEHFLSVSFTDTPLSLIMKLAAVLVFISLAFAGGKYFQRPVEIGGCDPPKLPTPTGKPYPDAQALTDKILALCGLPGNIEVFKQQSPEEGWAEPQYRRIYLASRNSELYKEGKMRWETARVIAHEIGHVLDRNDFRGGTDQNAADEFSGWALRRLGATHEEAMAGIVNEQAKAAVERGWSR